MLLGRLTACLNAGAKLRDIKNLITKNLFEKKNYVAKRYLFSLSGKCMKDVQKVSLKRIFERWR